MFIVELIVCLFQILQNLFSKTSKAIGSGKYKSLRQIIGHKEYELTDHLGNVRLTFIIFWVLEDKFITN